VAELIVHHTNFINGQNSILFPGQGSQYVGMGRSLGGILSAARLVFETADQALGFAISRLCIEGSEEDLKLPKIRSPRSSCGVDCGIHGAARAGVRPDYVSGHSLGEYSALVAAGSLKFTDAVRLVRKRGRFMQAAVPPGQGALAALLKLPAGQLDAILQKAAQGEIVCAANLNAPDQVVIAGHASAVNRAMELAKAAGARRVVPLAVSAPFHCSLMKPAQDRMATELEATAFDDLDWPLINNWQAHEVRTGAEARQGLIHQIPSTVRWEESIRYLAAQGVDRFFEVGPGGVLTGLLRSIDPTLQRSGSARRPT
jgi:[acyl-carrier-protein] S-malonyltransferase